MLHGIAKKRKYYCGGVNRSSAPPASRGGSGGGSRPLSHPTSYREELIFSIIIHACRSRSRQTLYNITFEFMRVMTSNWSLQHISDVIYPFQLKKPSIRFYSKHTTLSKIFGKTWRVNKNGGHDFFAKFEPSSRPISDLFTLFRKLFKVIFQAKWSSKGHEKDLESFLKTCFMRQISLFLSTLEVLSNTYT